MKLMRSLLCITMVFSLLTGCSSNEDFDVDEVLEKLEENQDSTLSSEVTMEMVMDVSVEAEGTKIDMNVDMAADIATVFGEDVNDSTSYMSLDMTMNALGLNESSLFEMYLVTNNDDVTTYSNEGEGWVKSTTATNEVLDLYSTTEEITDMSDVLSPKAAGKKDINGVECYVIELTLDQDSMDYSEYEEFADLSSLEEFSLTMELYVSTEDYMMMGLYADLSTFGNELFESVMGMGAQSGTEGYEVKVNEFYIDLKAKEYGKLDEIIIPDEVLEAESDSLYDYDYDYDYETVEGDVSTQTGAWHSLKTSTPHGDVTLNETTIGDLFGYGYTDTFEEFTAETTEMDDEYISTFFDKGDISFYASTGYGASADSIQDLKIDTISLDEESKDLSLPGGIKYGSTLSEVEEAYGEANTYTTWSNTESTNLNYSSDNAYLSIDIEDGVVVDIMMGYIEY